MATGASAITSSQTTSWGATRTNCKTARKAAGASAFGREVSIGKSKVLMDSFVNTNANINMIGGKSLEKVSSFLVLERNTI